MESKAWDQGRGCKVRWNAVQRFQLIVLGEKEGWKWSLWLGNRIDWDGEDGRWNGRDLVGAYMHKPYGLS